MKWITDLKELIFPRYCKVCRRRLTHTEHDKYRLALNGVATTTGEPAARNRRIGTTATGTTTANRAR